MANTAILLTSCPDRPGIVHEVTGFILTRGGNIVKINQCTDATANYFFMRVEFSLEDFELDRDRIQAAFERAVGVRFDMDTRLYFNDRRHRLCVFVTKETHCLFDLLQRCVSEEWNAEIAVIISNHEAIRPIAEKFDIPYYYLPIRKDNKPEQEARQLELIRQYDCSLVILARYMQILRDSFLDQCPVEVINIHHSFLPAFKGANPYRQAYEKGVKIFGATSHFVTADLDEGPIIAQDIRRVGHNESLAELVRRGKNIEKIVLARAVDLVMHHHVLVFRRRTIVLD